MSVKSARRCPCRSPAFTSWKPHQAGLSCDQRTAGTYAADSGIATGVGAVVIAAGEYAAFSRRIKHPATLNSRIGPLSHTALRGAFASNALVHVADKGRLGVDFPGFSLWAQSDGFAMAARLDGCRNKARTKERYFNDNARSDQMWRR